MTAVISNHPSFSGVLPGGLAAPRQSSAAAPHRCRTGTHESQHTAPPGGGRFNIRTFEDEGTLGALLSILEE
eukprot:6344261-Alexandrium_andersonii.AAC.1